MKKLTLFLLGLIFTFTFIPSLPAEDLTSLGDVDMVKIASYMQDGVLTVHVFYKNRDTDKFVSWEGETVGCEYSVYLLEGKIFDQKKGDLITNGEHSVEKAGQNIYIDIPGSYPEKSWAVVECEFNTGYQRLPASEQFRLK